MENFNQWLFSAPKLTPEFAVINWEKMSSTQIYNLERAVSGVLVPTCLWKSTPVKLFGIEDCSTDSIIVNQTNIELRPGYVEHHKPSNILKILCACKSSISVQKVGVRGKKIMSASDFYNGFLSKVPVNERYFTWKLM